MAQRLLLIFILASHLFVSGVLSTSILTVKNKCNYTIWPVLFSYTSQVSTTGFTLKRGEERAIQAPSSWHGLISARTLCSNDSRTFSCATGDCQSGKIECTKRYDWSPTTYVIFRIDYEGTNSYTISVEYGYNLPLMVVPSQSSRTCISSGCAVDLNKTCPHDLKVFSDGETIACESACLGFNTRETCCERFFKSKQNCKPTLYTNNFENACPLAYVYSYGDSNSTFICSNSTDYTITFCPSSIPNTTSNRNSMAPLAGDKDYSPRKLKPILGGSLALAVLIIIIATAVIVIANARRKNDDEKIEAIVMLKRYSFKQVKKMTNSFAHVLGEGGFGTVYKGKLPNASGRDIALKILKDSKGNGEDFINELASMSRASHVNIVSLFGFCYEGSNRVIIYEFMPNGSLDKFISENTSKEMDWNILYNIAVGVARGLEYMHNSCASRIVHFDIKPQNILMDEEFCPKISDFGLAKLCKKNDSIISMLDARGTAGYIAPEVYSKNYGGVSHKSDVYSYGMVILDLIEANNKERTETSKSNISTMYFPDWIYEDIEEKEAMRVVGDRVIEDEDDGEEQKIAKKMTLVGLWCIQTNPSDRPTMRKVVEMLEGSVKALQIPPKPLLNFPLVMGCERVEESQETSSFFTSS